jgi:hypothetical protein
MNDSSRLDQRLKVVTA